MSNSNKEKKEKHFIHKPVYEGGMPAMKTFIQQHLRYPAEALAAKIEGTVRLEYSINYQGIVTEAKVISGIGHGCDQEAMRIVKLFRFQVPKNRKVKVFFHKTINMHFKLPKIKPLAPQELQYTIVSKSSEKEAEPTNGGSYHYSIEL